MRISAPLLAWLLAIGSSSAFVSSNTRRAFSRTMPFIRSTRPSASKSSLSMYIDGLDTTVPSNLLSMSFAMPINALSITTSAIISDPSVEAEFLNDMAHVGLDLATFFGPATALLRLAAVIGRLCAIGSDYIPDHSMVPEEVIFQSIMLCIASSGFLKSFLPVVLASTAKTEFRDARAYQEVFEKVGVTWMQYKAMAAYALDWIHVEPGITVTSDEHNSSDASSEDYVYCLYRGDVQVSSAGQSLLNLTQGLLGERHLARVLDKKKKKQKKGNKEEVAHDVGRYPKTTIRAGGTGATLLRIKASKLTTLMDTDPEFAQSIRSLLLKGMEEKLNALLTTKNSATTMSA